MTTSFSRPLCSGTATSGTEQTVGTCTASVSLDREPREEGEQERGRETRGHRLRIPRPRNAMKLSPLLFYLAIDWKKN